MTKIFYIIFFNLAILHSNVLQIDKGNELPSSEGDIERFTPEQDSAYKKALNSRLPKEILLKETLDFIEINMEINRLLRDSPWMIARRNLASIPSEYFKADPVEIVHRQQMIQDAQYVPFVQTLPRAGFQVTPQEVGKLLGLIEDRTATIKYTLDHTTEVEIVIYSINAKVVATIFKGVQTPGSYQRTWNGRDDNGKQLPPGDYIGEVRIGSYRYVRKIIELGK
jgi:hypothetical protein